MVAPSGSSFELPAAAFALVGRARGEVETVLHGSSMAPTLPHGCRIRVRAVRPAELRPGLIAVVAYSRTAGFAHRIVSVGRGPVSRGYVITRGDGTPWCDRPVPHDQVLGVVSHYSTDTTWDVPGPCPPLEGRRRLACRVSVVGTRVLYEINVPVATYFSRALVRLGAAIRAA